MGFDYQDKIRFEKAKFYNFRPIPLPKVFKDGTGGFGKFAPDQGCIELYDSEGACAHLGCTRNFIQTILPLILTGETKTFTQWRDELYWKFRNAGFQSSQVVEVAQLEQMMIDILAQRAGKPMHRFMGAEKDWAAAYKGGGSLLLSDEELVDDMTRYVAEGYTTVKFKVGSDNGTNMKRDVERLRKVREAVGDKIDIAIDANQRWSVEDAVKFAELIKPYRPAWFEEPIHAHDMNGIAKMIDLGVDIPIAMGESMRISYAYETYVEKGVTHLQPSVGRMTRMWDLITIRDLARKNHVRFSSGGRIFLNVIYGCLYNEKEYIEYHEPINKPVMEYVLYKPEEKDGKFYMQTDISGNPQRYDLEKLENDGLLESYTTYYAEK